MTIIQSLFNILLLLVLAFMKFIRASFRILLLLVLAFAFILYFLDDSDNGKQWCVEVIAEFERDNSSIKFNEFGMAPTKILKRDLETSLYGGPAFWLDEDGSYRCLVPVRSLFPKLYEYTSERKEWKKIRGR
jgi:hypothetical protein